jgi:hypothetical protein
MCQQGEDIDPAEGPLPSSSRDRSREHENKCHLNSIWGRGEGVPGRNFQETLKPSTRTSHEMLS